MEQFVRSAEDVRRTFGYHPVPADLRALLDTVRFTRLLVVGGSVPDIGALVAEARTIREAELPSGLYWFSGLDPTLAMVVNAGTGTTDGVVVVDVGELSDDATLADAYRWAEDFWDPGRLVHGPSFDVGLVLYLRCCSVRLLALMCRRQVFEGEIRARGDHLMSRA